LINDRLGIGGSLQIKRRHPTTRGIIHYTPIHKGAVMQQSGGRDPQGALVRLRHGLGHQAGRFGIQLIHGSGRRAFLTMSAELALRLDPLGLRPAGGLPRGGGCSRPIELLIATLHHAVLPDDDGGEVAKAEGRRPTHRVGVVSPVCLAMSRSASTLVCCPGARLVWRGASDSDGDAEVGLTLAASITRLSPCAVLTPKANRRIAIE